jgi:RluA family pseudouridine synthase
MTEETVLQSKIVPAQSGQNLLDYLVKRFQYQDRAAWKLIIERGKVTVNGVIVSPQQILKSKDLVAYSVVLNEPPVDKNIEILHDEETFLIANKPGSLPSHADGNFIKNTFIYILTERFKNKGFEGKLNLVHRLDRETSGLMIVSKSRAAHQKLTLQFENGTIAKEYLAIARGVVTDDFFEVAGSIGKDPQSQISVRQKVVDPGTIDSKISLTRFEKIKSYKTATLLRCIPKTGRTNQIRVHLDSIGHSLIGDKLYGRTDDEFLEFIRHVKTGGDPSWPGHLETSRHMLHAARIIFQHPETGKMVTFEAPPPEDFNEYLKTLLIEI